MEQATQKLDPGFAQVGNIITKVGQVTLGKNGTVEVGASASGTWKYQFTAARKLDLARHIARATTGNAKAWLLQQKGITAASISVSGPIINLSGNNTLPDDLGAITING